MDSTSIIHLKWIKQFSRSKNIPDGRYISRRLSRIYTSPERSTGFVHPCGRFLKLLRSFRQFHMPVFDMTKENFLQHESWDVFKFGRKPVAIDIMTKVKGLDFKECLELATDFEDDGLKVKTLHLNHLLEAKKKAGRLKDLDDLDQLTKKPNS